MTGTKFYPPRTTFYSRDNRRVLGDNEKKEKVSFCMSGNPWHSLNPEKKNTGNPWALNPKGNTPRKCCVKSNS